MSIQWFPGHMNRARREVAKTMEAIDVIVEVLDARVPEASSNPMIAELRQHRQRPCLKVLNKADLADPVVTQAWLNKYNQEDHLNAIALSGKRAGQAAKIPSFCQPLAPSRNSVTKPLRMLIMGIPNVGKSTLVNTLLKRRLAQVGNEPAVTKSQQCHILNSRTTLIDSPGLLWPKIKHPIVGLMLATIHAIGANAVIDEEIAEFLATTLLARYPGLLTARYGFIEDGLDGVGVLEAIATKRGCMRKGKARELDKEKAARILLTEYRNGILGRTSLERPEPCQPLV
ncbi:MAG: ribosome biogenesis GTPase YlqF [Nitrospirales bacterium]|nr:ribosome biogenesis GTPase YlqF [Nitrospirales bacterium]